jgi:sigma-B regulation protein RsbU (phosphoserine phosphatase)
MNENQLLRLQFHARAERLGMVRALVQRAAETAGCSPELAGKLVIAVNEACMNVIQHAYKGDNAGEIILEMHNNNGCLLFRLLDHAEPVDIDCVKPRQLDDIRPGGLGTHFIREIMDECVMGHLEPGKGNYLEMKKIIS